MYLGKCRESNYITKNICIWCGASCEGFRSTKLKNTSPPPSRDIAENLKLCSPPYFWKSGKGWDRGDEATENILGN